MGKGHKQLTKKKGGPYMCEKMVKWKTKAHNETNSCKSD